MTRLLPRNPCQAAPVIVAPLDGSAPGRGTTALAAGLIRRRDGDLMVSAIRHNVSLASSGPAGVAGGAAAPGSPARGLSIRSGRRALRGVCPSTPRMRY
jgi:hypothetical protein